jgi:hypothetical protein
MTISSLLGRGFVPCVPSITGGYRKGYASEVWFAEPSNELLYGSTSQATQVYIDTAFFIWFG